MNVFDLITIKSATFYLNEHATLRQAIEKFDVHKFSVVPIIGDDGTYITTVSEGDILRYIKEHNHFDMKDAENVSLMKISHYRPYRSLSSIGTKEQIVQLITEQNFIPIVDDRNIYIGIIKRKEVIKYLNSQK